MIPPAGEYVEFYTFGKKLNTSFLQDPATLQGI